MVDSLAPRLRKKWVTRVDDNFDIGFKFVHSGGAEYEIVGLAALESRPWCTLVLFGLADSSRPWAEALSVFKTKMKKGVYCAR